MYLKPKAAKKEWMCEWRTIIHNSYLFIILVLIQAQKSPLLVSVESAGLGDTVTLHCEAEKMDVSNLYWYKQSPGCFPEMVASKVYDLVVTKPHLNLTLTKEEGATVFNLIIQNVTKGDEANYFCQQYSRASWNNCTFLSIKGKINCFHCSSSISWQEF